MQAPVGSRISADAARTRDLTPETITAFLVGMRSKVMTFTMQRAINDYRQEPLLAVPARASHSASCGISWGSPIRR